MLYAVRHCFLCIHSKGIQHFSCCSFFLVILQIVLIQADLPKSGSDPNILDRVTFRRHNLETVAPLYLIQNVLESLCYVELFEGPHNSFRWITIPQIHLEQPEIHNLMYLSKNSKSA